MVICWLNGLVAVAQNNKSVPQDTELGSGAINITVSTAEEPDGDSYFAEAERNEKSGDLNGALTLFGKAAFEYNSSRNFNAYGAALLKLSNVHLLLNNFNEAEQVILNVALKNYSRIGNRNGQMDSYSQLGKVYFASNKLTQSMWFYTQQGILARQLKNNPAYINSILGIISIKIKKKEYSLALKDVNKAELFARTNKVSQYNSQLKNTRSIIKGKVNHKK
jgi:tetratricopeptide (TPR) repeat protein